MDYSQPDYTLQAGSSALRNILGGLRKVYSSDPGLSLQLLLIVPILAAGIAMQINALQWVLITLVTLIFIAAGIFRTASLIQISNDNSQPSFHVSRIKSMGTTLLLITGGISLFTYMMVFVPMITQLL